MTMKKPTTFILFYSLNNMILKMAAIATETCWWEN